MNRKNIFLELDMHRVPMVSFSRRRSKEPVLVPKEEYEKYGIEDPRLIEIDHQIYLSYVVLSTYAHQGPIASTALATTTDFENYTRLGIITSKGSDDRDVVIFPEKIIADQKISNGTKEEDVKYFFSHRPSSWVGSKYGVDMPSIWLGQGYIY